ncbi:hypothetical protein M6B38_305435 [Iris pallida]|uniref:Uncharacterized protein n=1 Tax=Iris pallida TaxID=29817 RepID=A0AAX6HL93_IRIPA|nr:hypothetical protein M6B38_305435 [Iris pallida]
MAMTTMLPSPVLHHFDDEIRDNSPIGAPLFPRRRSLSSATARASMTTEISFSSGGGYFPDQLNRSPLPSRDLWLAVTSDDGATRSLPTADRSRVFLATVSSSATVCDTGNRRAERTHGAIPRRHLAVHDDEDLFVLSVSDTTRTVSDMDFPLLSSIGRGFSFPASSLFLMYQLSSMCSCLVCVVGG